MNKIFGKLPIDIVYRIIPYTYHLQDKYLLSDIKNYHESKKTIDELYHTLFIINNGDTEPTDKKWLLNDIRVYSNGFYAHIYPYCNIFYNTFFRSIQLQSKEQVNKYITILKKKNITTQINIFWGLFTKFERDEFIQYGRSFLSV